ncbi:FadR/GntR family transcriptional regulator [Cryobacterium roopkundense]|uniref:DNA-binding FadR family transcriptional regulator n=1 Tax=Cryobacterium roopkundense TaxID=1001240 RepID=A0A7W8ZU52_9MICO|nr:FCD domain-containing protein [Cryobacterium roopkundense]MBB5640276.1 DNA-binding FadR family transcriptional regulator [Cryobacterium roopkundense]
MPSVLVAKIRPDRAGEAMVQREGPRVVASRGDEPWYPGAGQERSQVRCAFHEGDDVVDAPAVSGGNAFEGTVQRLLQTVRLGLLAPGERLPAEREPATRLGVSRDTLRLALASVTEAGYLVSRRGRYDGTFVSDVLPPQAPLNPETARVVAVATPDHIEDNLVLREIVEVGAARLAASRSLSPIERQVLWATLADTTAAVGDDYRRLDSRLHITIGELAGSPSLVPFFADVRTRIKALLDEIPLLAPNIRHSDEQHEAIVSGILTGQPALAADAMREHPAGTAQLLRGFLE